MMLISEEAEEAAGREATAEEKPWRHRRQPWGGNSLHRRIQLEVGFANRDEIGAEEEEEEDRGGGGGCSSSSIAIAIASNKKAPFDKD
jgi:hypothetical protein